MTSVVAVVRCLSEVTQLVSWSERFAQVIGARELRVVQLAGASSAAEDVDLDADAPTTDGVVLKLRAVHKTMVARATPPTAEGWHAGDPVPDLSLRRLPAVGAIDALLKEPLVRAASLLVFGDGEGSSADRELGRDILLRVPCEVLWLRCDAAKHASRRILVPVVGGPNAATALVRAAGLAAVLHGTVDALIVEPSTGRDAAALGRRAAEQRVRRTVELHRDLITVAVALSSDPVKAITDVVQRGDYEVLLVGASPSTALRRFFSRKLPERLRDSTSGIATVGVLRQAMPLRSRLITSLDRFCTESVPQLDREGRLDLTERLRGGSSWNFDFIALVCLATIIAGIGLLRDSVAVIIGAMLVAPLMTPLVGSGLAIVQGNTRLLRDAARAVTAGFFLAFLIGLALGLVMPGAYLTSEMLARGEPGGTDLVVAVASGLAAAYATARPGLSGAIPGVAIAAALVPPIATSGIATALAWGEISGGVAGASAATGVARGAFFLFFVNIVAIVLSAAVSLFAVGVRIDRGGRRPWQIRLWLALLVVAALTMLLLSKSAPGR
jgi:uncharacterized hydrophobic protein (TIGR00271 family)